MSHDGYHWQGEFPFICPGTASGFHSDPAGENTLEKWGFGSQDAGMFFFPALQQNRQSGARQVSVWERGLAPDLMLGSRRYMGLGFNPLQAGW